MQRALVLLSPRNGRRSNTWILDPTRKLCFWDPPPGNRTYSAGKHEAGGMVGRGPSSAEEEAIRAASRQRRAERKLAQQRAVAGGAWTRCLYRVPGKDRYCAQQRSVEIWGVKTVCMQSTLKDACACQSLSQQCSSSSCCCLQSA